MSNARRDQNAIGLGLGVSSVDNVTPIPLQVDPVTYYVLTDMVTDTLSPTSATRCKIDQNDRKTMYGVSSVNGITLVPIRTDSSGRLLVTLS